MTAGSTGIDKCRAQCLPGEYSSTGLAPCNVCPRNFVSVNSGAKVCEECPPDTYTVDVASTSCSDVICPLDLCVNQGKCELANHRAICRCLPGFAGPQCEIDVDECESLPCYNGGNCLDEKNGYQCVCPAGFTGEYPYLR